MRDDQAEVVLRRLRDRFGNVRQSASAVVQVVTQAVHWADSLVERLGQGRKPDPVAHAALVAVLARRAAVDGTSVALEAVSTCRQLLGPDPAAVHDDGHPHRTEGERRAPSREELGNTVATIWSDCVREQRLPDTSWLTPWDELDDARRETAMRIGEGLFALGQISAPPRR